MENNLPKKVIYFFKIFVLCSLSFLFLGILSLAFRLNQLNEKIDEVKKVLATTLVNESSLSKDEIKELINESASGSSAGFLKEVKTPISVVKKDASSRVTYIPLGGSFLTQSTSWVDVVNAEVWLDFVGEYGEAVKASWDVFLRVDNANGEALARLFDVTHGTVVDGSEVSVSNKDKFTQVSSGILKPWAGRNLYRVQLKSLNSFSVFLDSPRLKISY